MSYLIPDRFKPIPLLMDGARALKGTLPPPTPLSHPPPLPPTPSPPPNLRTLTEILKGSFSCHGLQSLTCNLPSNLCNIFNCAHETHTHVTRSSTHGNLIPQACKNNSARRKFTSRGVVSFNSLPSSIKNPLPPNVKSLKVFFISITILCSNICMQV